MKTIVFLKNNHTVFESLRCYPASGVGLYRSSFFLSSLFSLNAVLSLLFEHSGP